ncbi:MAG: cobalt ECF transporter T component CbiQ [Desulfobacteraceae bacterium]|nr:cobalt ECF transporter T component CbiQ [Desulfobacteraceae bacterium]
MIKEVFAHGNSVIHSLKPETRIISAFIISVAAALCDVLAVAGIYLLISLLLIAIAKLDIRQVFKRLKPLFWFLLMIWIILPVTFEGHAIFHYGFLKISDQGVLFSAKITLKSVTIMLFFMALVSTMTVATLGHGLHNLRVPDKMVFLLLMSYRYIGVIEDEYKRLLRAARFRGFSPGTNMHSYKTYAYLAGMLFVRSSFRANRVHYAMKCRGFCGKFHTLDVYRENILNSVFLIVTFASSLLLVIIENLWK